MDHIVPSKTRIMRRAAFTLIELIVVIGIVAVLAGLLLPAVQKVRESAARIKCGNSLRQVTLAAHLAHDAGKTLPPGLGYWPSPRAFGTFHFHLLPYLEQNNIYNQSYDGNCYFVGNNGVYQQPIRSYICPSDPSVPASGQASDLMGNCWGVTSYAINAQVFAQVSVTGEIRSPSAFAQILASFPDGASNTIMLTEKYAQCFNSNYPAGGSFWGYYYTGSGLQPYHPGFAISWNGYSIGPASKFQVQPQPYNGGCDPTMASSPHPGGIQVGLVDGSVRFLSSDVSPYTWWYMCTPAGGEVLPPDGF